MIEDGAGLCRIDDQLSPLERGDIIIIGPERLHTFWSGPGSRIRIHTIFFEPRIVAPLGAGPAHHDFLLPFACGGPKYPLKIDKNTESGIKDSIRYICRIDGTPVDFLDRLEVLAKLYTILSTLDRLVPVRRPGARETLALRRWERINRLLSERGENWIELDVVAEKLGMSRWGFCRYFKTQTDLTWTEWLRRRSIDRACELLIGTDLQVSQIAVDVGFSNLSWFNRSFRRITGQSPTGFRKQKYR